VELKGLAHKKNERNVEYSFEVSGGAGLVFSFKEGRIVPKKELRKRAGIVRCQELVSELPGDRC